MAEKSSPGPKTHQREIILKALVDPGFRRQLAAEPARALGKAQLTPEKQREIALVLAVVKGIEAQISHLADELLCANNGPCGIA